MQTRTSPWRSQYPGTVRVETAGSSENSGLLNCTRQILHVLYNRLVSAVLYAYRAIVKAGPLVVEQQTAELHAAAQSRSSLRLRHYVLKCLPQKLRCLCCIRSVTTPIHGCQVRSTWGEA